MDKTTPLKAVERQAAKTLIQEMIAKLGTKVAAARALGISRQQLDRKLVAK